MSKIASLMTHSSLPSMGGTEGVPPVAIRIYFDCRVNKSSQQQPYYVVPITCQDQFRSAKVVVVDGVTKRGSLVAVRACLDSILQNQQHAHVMACRQGTGCHC